MRRLVEFPVQPWFQDHAFAGRAVLPAVEAMLLLAEAVRAEPGIDVRIMEDGRFARFLEIPPGTTYLPLEIETARDQEGARLTLLGRKRFKKMTRLLEHAAVTFPVADDIGRVAVPSCEPPDSVRTVIGADKVYREIVVFGPAYRTLRGDLRLGDRSAWGELHAPEFPFTSPVQEELGSPFPLDGALHAACVLGSQHVDFTPFPVGFRRRTVLRPTRAGGRYATRVDYVAGTEDELIFNLVITDQQGEVCEFLEGVRMRNVGRAVLSS